MCLQDLAIERRLQTRFATLDTLTTTWRLKANPTRHSLVVSTSGGSIRVNMNADGTVRTLWESIVTIWNGAGTQDLSQTVVLRVADLGSALAGDLEITTVDTSNQYAPYETYTPAQLDKLVQEALPI